MKLKSWVDQQVVVLARKLARSTGKSLNQLIRNYLQILANDNPDRSIEEFHRLSGGGSSWGRRFDRDEVRERS
jgi:hypothetical protein